MAELNSNQKEFFETLKSVQENIVYSGLRTYKKNENIEDLLFDVTYEAIYRIMELIDGYGNPELKLDLIDKESKESLRTNIELHDTCADFLKFET